MFDLGTGLRFFGLDYRASDSGPFRGTALVTHLHWDHVQGIPFFPPLLTPEASLDIHAPAHEDQCLADAVRGCLRPPYFPVGVDALPGEIGFHDTSPGEFNIGDAVVRAAWVPHCGPTLGYRVTSAGRSVAYISDHQQPGVGSTFVDPSVVELCADVDVLIHDAQYDADEFSLRHDWGHCTIEYAVEVAVQAGARTLVLFHHDPGHTDERIDELLAGARRLAERRGVTEVLAAHEGLVLCLPGAADLRHRQPFDLGAHAGAVLLDEPVEVSADLRSAPVVAAR